MNRKKLMISTTLIAVTLLSFIVIPVMAKPRIITIVMKYSDRTPYDGTFTVININRNQWVSDLTVDSHGKLNFEIPNPTWIEGDLIEVRKTWVANTWGSAYLNKKQSARIVIKDLPPPV